MTKFALELTMSVCEQEEKNNANQQINRIRKYRNFSGCCRQPCGRNSDRVLWNRRDDQLVIDSQKLLKDGWAELLKRENYSKGVIVRQDGNSLVLDIFVIALQGIKLSEVILGMQQRVKYELEKTLEVKVDAVNVTVQGVRVLK